MYHVSLKRQFATRSSSPKPGNTTPSELHIIVQQPDFLSGLERWQSDIRTAIAAEGVSQRAVPARTDLALHGEIHFREIGGVQTCEVRVGFGASGFIFGGETLGEAAAAVFAGASALGVGFAGFGCG
jgi:hypothetical protein